ncbi:hypothetical protein CASFOL_012833 [Castilleja foliolosa]|uniref:non-specific serine/threonine protein kinase n=1 Tax=Castilleja foliolosa TaxID=1961234 RepID=A0ABD3DIS8_9LAMI
MGQSPSFGGVQATRQSNATGNQAGAPSIPAGSQAAGPSNPAGLVRTMPTVFSLRKLKKATKNFSINERIDIGRSAHVFRGKLKDGQIVAVKRMINDFGRSEIYGNEMGVLSLLKHRNIINLIGCCVHKDTERIIVYEFMTNRTLHYHLHDRGQPVLDWKTRMKIGAGIAEGLSYLHDTAQVIHRDLKPGNVLLDADYNPKICDFGTSILLPADTQTHNAVVWGKVTPPYCPPSDVHPLSLKYDVYSFGVVLLEIITGIVAIRNGGNRGFIDDWVLFPENFVQQADRKMKGKFPRRMLVRAMTVATKCMNLCPDSRPDIGVVVNAMKYLEGEQDAHWPEIFNTEWISHANVWPELFDTDGIARSSSTSLRRSKSI